MAITVATYKKNYFQQVDADGRQPLLSSIELAGVTYPKYFGKFLSSVEDETLMTQLMLSQSEDVAGGEQFTWRDEQDASTVTEIVGGYVSRAVNVFSLSGAIPTDANDIDSNRPTGAQFICEAGMQFLAVDATGKMDYGRVVSVAADNKSITAETKDGADWTVGTSGIDLIFTGYNLDHCECPPCIGYRDYSPLYENSWSKDGECVTYCDETETAYDNKKYTLFEDPDGGHLSVDDRLDQAIKALILRNENKLLFGDRLSDTKATAAGEPRGTKGIIPQITGKALQIEGYIESMADLTLIAQRLKREGVKQATIRANTTQYNKLVNLVPPTSPYFFSPFENHQNDLVYLGFKGVDINGVKLIFKEIPALSYSNLGKKYYFVVIPEGTVNRKVNGSVVSSNYLTLLWFGNAGKTWKFLRRSKDLEEGCGNTKVTYETKFMPIVAHAHKWILGVAPAA